MRPLVKPRPEDGLADLLGTRGAHAALGLVEFDAGGLEFKPAEIENPAHVPLEIVHHILVVDSQHAPRQRRVPVLHQLEVGPVIARDVIDAVGKFLAARIELLEVPKAAGHRLSARINDRRSRQHQVDQPDVAEVVRHFVDEVRLAGAVDLRVREVLLAERAKILSRHRRQASGVARIVEVGVVALQVEDRARYVGEFLCSFYLRMRGKNLLEER